MPITALMDDGTRVRSRHIDDDEWDERRSSRTAPAVFCPSCSGEMHHKRSPTGLKFFAHNPGGPDCVLDIRAKGGESGMHMAMKDYVADAIDRVPGWEGIPERRVDVDDTFYVADVYAERIDGKTVRPGVFEIQLSAKSDVEMQRRNTFRQDSGAVTTWITRQQMSWERSIPTLRVEDNGNGRLQIIDGLMVGDHDRAAPTLLERYIRQSLAGKYLFIDGSGIYSRGDWSALSGVSRAAKSAPSTGTGTASDDCHRVPQHSTVRRPALGNYHRTSMTVEPVDIAPEGVRACGWMQCPATATTRVKFISGAAWEPFVCDRHAASLVELQSAVVA